VYKYASPVLILCIFALFAYSIASQSDDALSEQTEPRAEQTQPPAEPARVEQKAETSSADPVDRVRGELERLSSDVKANSDKISQIASLRTELLNLVQDSKSNRDEAAHVTDQMSTLRADILKQAKEEDGKAAQALRDEVSATQTKLAAQIDDVLKTNTSRSDALSQRADAMKKDIDDLKRSFDEDRQNTSSISPGAALVVAILALVLGPYLAYQLAANKLESVRRQAMATQPAKSTEAERPTAASIAVEPEHGPDLQHQAPPLGEGGSPHQSTDEDLSTASEQEKV
jgi:small-conductance mechanosensitive channel